MGKKKAGPPGKVQEAGRDFYRVTRPAVRRAAGTDETETGVENRIAKAVVDTAFQVHTALGPGLLESVYEVVLAHELRALGFKVERQVPISIKYKGIVFEKAYLADIIVEEIVIVELKSVESIAPIHAKQLLTQLRLTQKKLGLLINFGAIHLKDNIRRLANGLGKPDVEL